MKKEKHLETILPLENNCIRLLTVMEKGYLKLHVSCGPFSRLRKSPRWKYSTLIQRHFWKRVSSGQIIFATFLLLNLVFVLWLQTFPNVTCYKEVCYFFFLKKKEIKLVVPCFRSTFQKLFFHGSRISIWLKKWIDVFFFFWHLFLQRPFAIFPR